jgi:hypothetical protein
MPHPDIATALVTEPPLMALVVVTGLAVGASLAVFVVDVVTQLHRRESLWLPAISTLALRSFSSMRAAMLTTLATLAGRRTSA